MVNLGLEASSAIPKSRVQWLQVTTGAVFAEELHRNDRSSWEEGGLGKKGGTVGGSQLCSGAGFELTLELDSGLTSSRCAPGNVCPESDPLGGSGLSHRFLTGPPHFLPQEIVHKGHAVTEETFSFLLMGCIQDKKTGFRYALQVCPSWLCLPVSPAALLLLCTCGQVQMMILCSFLELLLLPCAECLHIFDFLVFPEHSAPPTHPILQMAGRGGRWRWW